MELDICTCCGKKTVVHGYKEAGVMLCDDCCPCYNHMPGGKYYEKRMTEWWKKK